MRQTLKDDKALRSLGAITAALIAGYAVIGAYAVHSSMPFNLIRLPLEEKDTVRLLLPESWKFFTRNPQEEQTTAFLAADGEWRPASAGPNSSGANLYGLDRSGRAQGVELGLVAQDLPAASWIDCKEAPTACLDRAPSAAIVKNPTPNAALCGDVGVVLQKPVPWAWARSRERVVMPSRVARITVQCSKK